MPLRSGGGVAPTLSHTGLTGWYSCPDELALSATRALKIVCPERSAVPAPDLTERCVSGVGEARQMVRCLYAACRDVFLLFKQHGYGSFLGDLPRGFIVWCTV